MKPRRPDYEDFVRSIFHRAAFIRDLAVELVHVAPGVCETAMPITPRLLQQDGFVHAGVTATLADHTAGGAAGSLVGEGETVLTSEYKIHFLRPAKADRLTCRGTVLKPGSMLIVSEAEVYAGEVLVAKMISTLAVVSVARAQR
ncbi:MAG: PaaI family thioesterase [Polyangiaceae bacterium]